MNRSFCIFKKELAFPFRDDNMQLLYETLLNFPGIQICNLSSPPSHLRADLSTHPRASDLDRPRS